MDIAYRFRYPSLSPPLVMDSSDSLEITEDIKRQILSLVEHNSRNLKFLHCIPVQATVFFVAGTLIGLIQMLIYIDYQNSIGPSLSVALIVTFYGIIFASLGLTPRVTKVNCRTEHEVMLIKLIRLGVAGIHNRLNPHNIQRNINYLLPLGMKQ